MQTGREKLIDLLVKKDVLKTDAVMQAFKRIDRKDFVPVEYSAEAYANYALPIGHGQTISQPYTVAFMLTLLDPHKGENILDVGSGSGWSTTLLADIVGKGGFVRGVERVSELVKFGQDNLAKYNFSHASIVQATKELGLPQHGPYDRILVSAADIEVPEKIVQQLKIGGTLVIPVEDAIWKVTHTSESDTKIEKHEGFVFVPLIH